MNALVNLIRDAVKPYPKPCVNLSGIDSAIILHHLTEKTDGPIHTYTIGFDGQPNEFHPAAEVAEHYGTIHREIVIKNMLAIYPQILALFMRPRFNLWPYWAARAANEDGCETCYIGEGGDEHFGGYYYKPRMSYVQHWAGLFTYVHPTYQTIYRHFGIRLETPLHPDYLPWRLTLPYYDVAHEKRYLRKAYRGILPDFVVERKKQNGRFSYWIMWEDELKPYFPDAEPRTEQEIRDLLNHWVIGTWLRVHNWRRRALAYASPSPA